MVHIVIPLERIQDGILKDELFIPTAAKNLIIFAHGSGSSRASPRNHYVANILNQNGFATFLVDLLTTEEQQSDVKTQKILDRYPSLTLNKFNIKLFVTRLETITTWLIGNNISEVKNLPLGYFGSSTGAAASIEAAVISGSLLRKYML